VKAVNGINMTTVIDNVKTGIAIPDSKFAVPEGVKLFGPGGMR